MKILVAELAANRFDAIIYTDAAGDGGVGACIIRRSGAREYAQGYVPRKWVGVLKKRRTQINPFELLAFAAAVRTWMSNLRFLRVLVYVDNQAAVDGLISGWSKHEDVNNIIRSCWLEIAAASSTVEFR